MMLLRLITWPYVRKHMARCLLTTAGIVLGVAVFVGMHTANQSVVFAFNKTVDKIAGATQLQVSAGETGFDESVLQKVQEHPDVEVAVPVIEAPVNAGIAGTGNLLVLGVDMTGDRNLRDYDFDNADEAIIDDPLVFIAQPDSIMVTRQFAERAGLKLNDKLTMNTMAGPKQFTVRGVMKGSGLASAFGGNLAVMDIYAAQLVFGRGRTFDRVDIGLREGVNVDAAAKSLQTAVGDGVRVDPPSARGAQFEAMAKLYSMTANVTSLFALFIGLFLIYNTFSIAVSQRRSEIGILRALGASAGQIRNLFLIESGIAGLFGSLIGLGAGMLIARGLANYLSGMFTEIYGVSERAEEVATQPALLAGALVLGVLTSLIAGWIPARAAASVDPVKALQKGQIQIMGQGENRLRRILAILCLGAATACVAFGHNPVAFYSGYMLSIVGSLLLMPAISNMLARLLRPVLKLLRPVEGALAADSLLQAPKRTSGTVAALALSIALVIGLAGIAKSSYAHIFHWMDSTLNPDLFVSASESITQRSFRFPIELGAELEKVPGVEEVQAVRSSRILYQGTPVMLVATDVRKIWKRIRVDVIDGDRGEMLDGLESGRGVIISDNFALLRKVNRGDILEVPAPGGVFKVPVLGVVMDFSDQQGTIIMDRKLFLRHWDDTTVNVFRLYLDKNSGLSEAQVRQTILDRFSDRTRLFVFTNAELRSYILKITDQWFGITYVQIFVAVLVAILGIVNSLTVSIADRKRELGVLQAVGGLRNQIRHTIWMEALAIGLIGVAIGFVLGAVNLYHILEVARRDLAGLRLAYSYPFSIAFTLLPVMLGAALVSAIGPAESAVRGSLVEALEYE
jgi:putative ABC transport system permease protein